MPWARIDTNMTRHPKVLALGSVGRRWCWLELVLFTVDFGSDVVPRNVGEAVRGASEQFLSDCVDVGLLELDGRGVLHVHDWHKYQAGDRTKAARQQRWRDRRREEGGESVDGM